MTLRTLSKGKKSIEDFCRAFAGPPSTGPEVKPYTFEDVVRTLNSVQPYDWAAFLNQRLESTAARAPLNGITNGGYNLVYTDERSGIVEDTRRRAQDRSIFLIRSASRRRIAATLSTFI